MAVNFAHFVSVLFKLPVLTHGRFRIYPIKLWHSFPSACTAEIFRQAWVKEGRWGQGLHWKHGMIVLDYIFSSQRYRKQRLSILYPICNSAYRYIHEKKYFLTAILRKCRNLKHPTSSLIVEDVSHLRQYSALCGFSSPITITGSRCLGLSWNSLC